MAQIMRRTWRSTVLAIAALAMAFTTETRSAIGPLRGIPNEAQVAADSVRIRAPLPLEVAVSLHRHNHRAPVNLSPDGQWIAHTVATHERVPRGTSYRYSDTGVPFADSDARMQAILSGAESDEEVLLGDSRSSSWAPVWSPDGGHVAFYSDEGGEAGLWIWDQITREQRRVPDIIVRPIVGFETPRWSSSGDRLLVKVLPVGRSLADANAFDPARTAEIEMSTATPGEPSVTVRRSKAAEEQMATSGRSRSDSSRDRVDPIQALSADLAIVDTQTGRVRRIVQDTLVRSYAFSPDDRYIVYTVWVGWDDPNRQNLYDINLVDRRTGITTELGKRVGLGSIGWGHEWSFSPDGRRLAYVVDGDVTVVSLPTMKAQTWEDRVPGFDPVPPIWSGDGQTLFTEAKGALWSLDVHTGEGSKFSSIPGWDVRNLITPSYLSPVGWMSEGRLWVTARERDGGRSGLFAIDPSGGASEPRLQEVRSYGGVYSLAASNATGEIAFVASGQQELEDLWLFDTERNHLRRGSRINEGILGYELGAAQVIRWRSNNGEKLAGALLLPPGHESPERLPLLVYVYGGKGGSDAVDQFGLLGQEPTFNMHVVATRGYAVFYPDAPLRTGRTIDDLVGAVLPGVDAVIDAGYADPDHVAIMGHSFGAYNVLSILTRTNRFRAALISATTTHPDLFAAYLRNPGYFERGQGNMGGTIWEHPQRYWANSPLFGFPGIETPVLIAQGEEDGVVGSEAIFAAFDRLGKSVEYLLYGGEDHVITRPANVIDLWKRRLDFLSKHLGLSVEPDGHVRIP